MSDRFDFEGLMVYQKALDFTIIAYNVCESFPALEKFALADQFRRAAASIALNIAEGTGGSKVEFRRFLKIARRSIRECIAIVTIAKRKNYFDYIKEMELRKRLVELSKMISGLIVSLK